MNPAQIYQGDRIRWIEQPPEGTTALVVWLRGATQGAGTQAVGTLTTDGWRIELTPQVTSSMAPGAWSLQVVATVDGGPITARRSSITVRRGLAFSGTAAAFDDRSQLERDLDAAEEAIRVLASGAQEYTIGTSSGGRRFRRPDLPALIEWRDQLKSELASQKRAEALSQGTAKSRQILVSFQP